MSKEVWWIYAPERHPWGGLRIAHFHRIDDHPWFSITNEPLVRVGIRDWAEVSVREGWVKVKQIQLPTRLEVHLAVDAKMLDIVQEIKTELMP